MMLYCTVIPRCVYLYLDVYIMSRYGKTFVQCELYEIFFPLQLSTYVVRSCV